MAIKYEIQPIKNVQNTGRERRFARIFEQEPMTAAELEAHIQNNCTLTRGDIAAVLKALRDCIQHDLMHGRRFCMPEIGSFSLSVDLDMPDALPDDKARADYISVRGIRFRPDASLLGEVQRGATFERARFSSKSREYDEEELVGKIQPLFARLRVCPAEESPSHDYHAYECYYQSVHNLMLFRVSQDVLIYR